MSVSRLFLAGAALACVATEATAAERHRFDIPGGRLGSAIVALGRQAGVSIGLSDSRLANAPVRPVRGNLTVEQALAHLLSGTGARAVFVDRYTIRIVRAQPPRPASRQPRRALPLRRPPSPPPPRLTAQAPAQDIIVVAAKRPIPMGSYPGPVTIVGGDDPMLASGVPGTDALVRRLPSLSSTHLGTGRNKLFVRGIADSSFTGPTQATVGQYLGETRLNFNGPDPDLRLYDVDRVELLPGPQGTLYGAGSLGGIIRVLPNAPDMKSFEGSASVGASATMHGAPGADASAFVNIPLVNDRLALRAVGYGLSEGGYIDDPYRQLRDVNRVRVLGGRAALRAAAGPEWIVDLNLVGQSIRGDDAQFADAEGPPLTRSAGADQAFRNDYLLGQLVVTRTWGTHRLVVAGSGVRQDLREVYDFSILGPNGRSTIVVEENLHLALASVEARLSNQKADGAGWLLGSSLVSNQSEQPDRIGQPDLLREFARVRNRIVEGTVFGEGTLRLARGVTATLGGRFNYSRLTSPAPGTSGAIPGPIGPFPEQPAGPVKKTETLFLPSASLAARRGDLLLFARHQQAYRPGGIDFVGLQLTSFRRDKVAATEVGIRYGAPGRGRVSGSASVAYTLWTDIQADIVNGAGRALTANIGDGRIYTLDLNAGWRPLRDLALDASLVVNDSRVDDPNVDFPFFGGTDVDHAPLPNVAKINARVGAEYQASVRGWDARLWGASRYAGKSILGIGAPLSHEQGGWMEVDAGARIVRGRHALTVDATNLLDVKGNRFSFGSPYSFARARQITPLRPLTVRVGYEVAF